MSQGFDYLNFIRRREFPPHVVKLSISHEKRALFIQNGFKFCTNQCNEINHIVHEEIPESTKRPCGHWNSKFLKFLGPGGLVQYNSFSFIVHSADMLFVNKKLTTVSDIPCTVQTRCMKKCILSDPTCLQLYNRSNLNYSSDFSKYCWQGHVLWS